MADFEILRPAPVGYVVVSLGLTPPRFVKIDPVGVGGFIFTDRERATVFIGEASAFLVKCQVQETMMNAWYTVLEVFP